MWVRLSAPPTPDVAWLLYAAGVLRDGGVLGVDIVENSPPIIFWLKVPVLTLGAFLGFGAWPAWVGALLLASAASAWLVHRLAQGLRHGQWLGLLAFLIFILLPGRDFGQREHVTLILSVPWLVAIACRLEGRPAQGVGVWWAIVLAAIGLGIKPHFLFVWLSIAALLVLHTRSLRVLFARELSGVAVLGVLQVLAVVWLESWYLEHVKEFGRAYIGFLAIPIWQALIIRAGSAAVFFALLTRLAFRRDRDQASAGSTALLVCAVGFWLAAGLQQKGWSYHYLPAAGLALLTLGAILTEASTPVSGAAARLYGATAFGVLAGAFLAPSVHAILQFAHVERIDRRGLDPNFPQLLPLVRSVGRAGGAFVFSTNIASSFPLVSEAGTRWAFRHPSLLMLGAAYSQQFAAGGPIQPRPLAERTSVEKRLTLDLIRDLERFRPAVMLVLNQDASIEGWGGARRFDYIGYFQADPQFREILSEYRRAGTLGDYSILVRHDSSVPISSTGQMLVAVEQQSIARRSAPIFAGVDATALFLFCVATGLAWWDGKRKRGLGS